MRPVYLVSGVIALAIAFSVYIFRKKTHMTMAKMIDDVFWAVNYFSKGSGALTGAAQATICVVRDYVFYSRAKNRKWAEPSAWCIVFLLFFATIPIYTWTGWISLFPAISSLVSTVGLFQKNPKLARRMGGPAALIMLVYTIAVGNIFGTLSQSFMILSSIIGILREKKEPKEAA